MEIVEIVRLWPLLSNKLAEARSLEMFIVLSLKKSSKSIDPYMDSNHVTNSSKPSNTKSEEPYVDRNHPAN